MIPEILLSLVGFTGGAIIEENGTFAVNMSFDMVTEAEKVWYTNMFIRFGLMLTVCPGTNQQNRPSWLVLPGIKQVCRGARCEMGL